MWYTTGKRRVNTCTENVKESVEEALEEAQDQIEEGADEVKKADGSRLMSQNGKKRMTIHL